MQYEDELDTEYLSGTFAKPESKARPRDFGECHDCGDSVFGKSKYCNECKVRRMTESTVKSNKRRAEKRKGWKV